ncbi:MAG TPA: DUF402 domain-containing protein [Mycobacteriales bacterium]|nr:DUF402 domain-containing protein [Mycobacteriales bacterium]
MRTPTDEHLTPQIAAGVAPPGAVEAAAFGYWSAGDLINWHYRRPGALLEGGPVLRQNVLPMRVIRDDERGLIAWLAGGTVGIAPVRADGRQLSRGAGIDFGYDWRLAVRPWVGTGTLRIAPAGMPWSVWLFWRPGWEFADWYINLEDAHLRDADGVYSCDHVLDLVLKPTGECLRKDEDELAAALEQGRFDAAQVRAIEANAEVAAASIANRDWPFDPSWCEWRPDPAWAVPTLDPALTAGLDPA